MAEATKVIDISRSLDELGLIWHPEVGDEISKRKDLSSVSILVDPQGLTPGQLRDEYLWLPNVEQLVNQFEARQALIQHVGINEQLAYEAVIHTQLGVIEARARSLRIVFGKALRNLLVGGTSGGLH